MSGPLALSRVRAPEDMLAMAASPRPYRLPSIVVVAVFLLVAVVGLVMLVWYDSPPPPANDEPGEQLRPEVKEPPADLEPIDERPEPGIRLEPEPETQPHPEPEREPAPGPYPPPSTTTW